MNTNTIALDALKAAYITMQHMGNVLNNMDAVDEDEDAEHDAAFEAVRAAIAALEAQPQPSAQGPEEIFLQLHGDCLPHETDLPVVYTDDSVTWCWHRINDSDVRYIRADLAANPKD